MNTLHLSFLLNALNCHEIMICFKVGKLILCTKNIHCILHINIKEMHQKFGHIIVYRFRGMFRNYVKFECIYKACRILYYLLSIVIQLYMFFIQGWIKKFDCIAIYSFLEIFSISERNFDISFKQEGLLYVRVSSDRERGIFWTVMCK